MVLFPNAKINLGLNIVSKRSDGFHDIETCFLPVGLSDVLEFIESSAPTSFTSSGIDIPGNPTTNLCVQAWQLLHKDYQIPNVEITLHKIIPIGAGLGGGSSDAAFMLKGLNEYFGLKLTETKLENYAALLGSDCAFFIRNTPSFARGRGELLEPLDLNLSGYQVVLINPNIHIGTAEAYAGVTPAQPEYSLSNSVCQAIEQWKGVVKNDFETGIFKKHKDIEAIKNMLYKNGAAYAAMSGSGSTVFGLFKNEVPAEVKKNSGSYFYWQGEF